jgi:hypothetical protein
MIKPLSWSEKELFCNDEDAWFGQYVLGIRQLPTRPMIRGTDIHKMLLEGQDISPELYSNDEVLIHEKIRKNWDKEVTPYVGLFAPETRVEVCLGDIPVCGVMDGVQVSTGTLIELKTGSTSWTKHRAENHGQLMWYSAMYEKQYGEKPKRIILVSASTKSGTVAVHHVDLSEDAIKMEMEEMARVWAAISDYHHLRFI